MELEAKLQPYFLHNIFGCFLKDHMEELREVFNMVLKERKTFAQQTQTVVGLCGEMLQTVRLRAESGKGLFQMFELELEQSLFLWAAESTRSLRHLIQARKQKFKTLDSLELSLDELMEKIKNCQGVQDPVWNHFAKDILTFENFQVHTIDSPMDKFTEQITETFTETVTGFFLSCDSELNHDKEMIKAFIAKVFQDLESIEQFHRLIILRLRSLAISLSSSLRALVADHEETLSLLTILDDYDADFTKMARRRPLPNKQNGEIKVLIDGWRKLLGDTKRLLISSNMFEDAKGALIENWRLHLEKIPRSPTESIVGEEENAEMESIEIKDAEIEILGIREETEIFEVDEPETISFSPVSPISPTRESGEMMKIIEIDSVNRVENSDAEEYDPFDD
jgi:hypothetical protein